MTILKVVDVHAYYGDSHVLQGVTLDVAKGAVTAVLGRNGVGKTTLCRSIIGLTPPREGSVLFDGVEIARLPTHRIFNMGIGLVPQGRRIFSSLTVQENLAIAVRPPRSPGVSGTPGWDLDKVFSVFPRLSERSGNRGNELSGGEQQMLAIGRALLARPRLLLLDEPSLGLAPMVVTQIFRTLRALKAEGKTIFLVEQNARQALRIADRGYVMERGQIVLEDTGESLLNNPEVQHTYLGKRAA